RPTPHQANREPQPRALRANEAPVSGADVATPCGGNRFYRSRLSSSFRWVTTNRSPET
ncbi:hypothetical protein GOODEAATRI_034279, partial [Goodea atripinnis]